MLGLLSSYLANDVQAEKMRVQVLQLFGPAFGLISFPLSLLIIPHLLSFIITINARYFII